MEEKKMTKKPQEKSVAMDAEADSPDETNGTYHNQNQEDRHNDQRCSSTNLIKKDSSPSDTGRNRDRSKSPLSPTSRPSYHTSMRGRSSVASRGRNASSNTVWESKRSSRYGSRRGCPSATSASRSRSRSSDGSRTRSPSVSVSRSRSRSKNASSPRSRRSPPRCDSSVEQAKDEVNHHTDERKSASPLRRAKTDGSHSKKRHNSTSPLRRVKTDGCYCQEMEDSSRRHQRPAKTTSGCDNKQPKKRSKSRSKSPKRSTSRSKSGSEGKIRDETKLGRTRSDGSRAVGNKGSRRKSPSPHRSVQRAQTDDKTLQDAAAATAMAGTKHPAKPGSTSLRRTVSEGYQTSPSKRQLRVREADVAKIKSKRCESASDKAADSLTPGNSEGKAVLPELSKLEATTKDGSSARSKKGRRQKSPSSQHSSQQIKTSEKRVRNSASALIARKKHPAKSGSTSLKRAVSEGHKASPPTRLVCEGHASPSQTLNKDLTSFPGQRPEHLQNRPSDGCAAKTRDDRNEEEEHNKNNNSPTYKCRSRRHKHTHANSVLHAQVEHGVAHQDKLLEVRRITQQQEQQKQYQQWQEEMNKMGEEKQEEEEEEEPEQSGGGILGQSVSTLLNMPLAAATMAPKLVTGTAVVAAKTTVAATATAGAAASITAQAVGSGALATANTAAHVITGAANVALNFVPFSVTEQSYEHNDESVKSHQAKAHNPAALGGRPLVVGPQID